MERLWFDLKKFSRVFVKQFLREDYDGWLILWKLKVFFAPEPERLDCGFILIKVVGFLKQYPREEVGLRVDFTKERDLFSQKKLERRLDCKLISLEIEIFFHNDRNSRNLDRPSVRSGGWKSQRRDHTGRPSFGARIIW